MIIEIEVHCGQPWGDECTIGQVKSQAVKSGLETLAKLLEGNKDIRVIGKPKIKMISTGISNE